MRANLSKGTVTELNIPSLFISHRITFVVGKGHQVELKVTGTGLQAAQNGPMGVFAMLGSKLLGWVVVRGKHLGQNLLSFWIMSGLGDTNENDLIKWSSTRYSPSLVYHRNGLSN